MEIGYLLGTDFTFLYFIYFLTIWPCIHLIFQFSSLCWAQLFPCLDRQSGQVGNLTTSSFTIPHILACPSACFSNISLVFSILYSRSYFFSLAMRVINSLNSLFLINSINLPAQNSSKTHFELLHLAVWNLALLAKTSSSPKQLDSPMVSVLIRKGDSYRSYLLFSPSLERASSYQNFIYPLMMKQTARATLPVLQIVSLKLCCLTLKNLMKCFIFLPISLRTGNWFRISSFPSCVIPSWKIAYML